jgi:calcineurin-like phosphoesterase family protein
MREGTEPPDAGSTDGMSPADEPLKTPVEPAPPLEPVEPVGPVDAGPPSTPPGSVARSIALGVVAFVATIALLAGFFGLVARSGGRGAEASTPPAPTVGAASSASATPSSAPAAVGSGAPNATLVGAGDIADCSLDKGAATATIVDGIAGTVFTAGDNAYPNGTAQQFTDCYDPTWGRFKPRTRPAAGNHDWLTKDAAGYLGYFGAAAAPSGKTWYSYDLGAWHVIVLDSDCQQVGGCTADSPQGTWLASDLAASKATKCTIAIWHHPRFSSGEHGNDADVAPFWKALYAAGAEIVVNGHDHDYERFAPQDPDGHADDTGGIRQFVVGTGGAELRTFPTTRPNSVVRASVAFGVIQFTLHQSSYDWKFISTTGEFSDSGAGACH